MGKMENENKMLKLLSKMLLFVMSQVRLPTRKIFSQGFMGKWLSKAMSSGRRVRGWELTGEKKKAIQNWAGSQAVSPKETSGNSCSVNLSQRCTDSRRESWSFIHWFQASPEKWERHKFKSPHTQPMRSVNIQPISQPSTVLLLINDDAMRPLIGGDRLNPS